MNRLGALLLAIFLVVGIGFVLSIRSGGEAPPPAPSPGVFEPGGPLSMPVAGVAPAALVDSFGDARGGGARHHGGIDIMAARGTPVIAAAPGTVERIFESADGGHTVYVRSDDGQRVYYYAHLDGYAPGLAEGQRLATGAPVGTVGFTGNASAAGPHLHFEVKLMNPGEAWHQGTAIDPYPLLTGRR